MFCLDLRSSFLTLMPPKGKVRAGGRKYLPELQIISPIFHKHLKICRCAQTFRRQQTGGKGPRDIMKFNVKMKNFTQDRKLENRIK